LETRDETPAQSARKLILQYGEDAEVVAVMAAAEAAAAGDLDSLERWDRVREAIAAIVLPAGNCGAA
jgi:hypothetical protein